jgi:Protein of unknown function (DUF1214)
VAGLEMIDWSFFSMASYLRTADPADRSPLSGAAWDGFLARLAEAGRLITDGGVPAAAVDRASAFRGLLQLLYFGTERTLGSADPARPVFSRPWPMHLFDYGAGNPDAVYRTVSLRDDVTYRISGTLGNAAFMSFEFFDGATQAGSLLAADLRPDPAGRFEILLGPRERDGHWLELVPGTSYLLSREFFSDWAAAEPSALRIECLDEPIAAWPAMSADRVRKELEALGTWLVETVRVFAGAQAKGLAQFANQWDPHVSRPASDLPAIYHAYWNLQPGECLLLEAPAPSGEYWGIQLANSLWNTLDYANRQTSLNRAQAHIDPDGMFRAVLAHADPGVANWLDTVGHQQGSVHLRVLRPPVPGAPARPRPRRSLAETRDDWMKGWDEEEHTGPAPGGPGAPTARVLPLARLDAALPASTARVTAAQRRRILDGRLRQVTRLQRG